MARFDYNEYESAQVTKSVTTQKSKVGYFNSLKDNGDTAIVRFAYHSPSEFDIVTIHKIQVDGKWRSMSCLKGPYDAASKCPLCAAGEKLNRKMYVKMLEYQRDDKGNVIPHAVVWERPAEGKNDFVKKLMSIIGAGYRDLSQYVFTIRRNGARGSLETTYEINPAHPDIYPNSLYVADFSDFIDFDLAHHSYMERPYGDLVQLVETGSLPPYKPSQENKDDVVISQKQKSPETQYYTAPGNDVNAVYSPQENISHTTTLNSSLTSANSGLAFSEEKINQYHVNSLNIAPPQTQTYVNPQQDTRQPVYNTQSPVDGVRPRRTNIEF